MTGDIQQPDISIRDLEQRWGLSRNGLKARAKALGVELVRVSSTCTVWPGDFVELGDRLHEHLQAGNQLATFPGLAPVSESNARITKKEDSTTALVAAMAAAMAQAVPKTPEDPLRRARGLAEAADAGLVLTTDDLIALGVKGVDGFADGGEAFGYRFSKHRQRNRTLWTIERSIGKSKPGFSLPASSSGKSVGFATALFAATTIG